MKKYIKYFAAISLMFTALSLIALAIDFTIKSTRALTEVGVIKTSIPVTESSIETVSHWIVGLWLTPLGAIFLGMSLGVSLTWFYVNRKGYVKKQLQKINREYLGYE